MDLDVIHRNDGQNQCQINVKSKEGNYQPAYKEIRIELICLDKTVLVNGKNSSIINL